MKNLIIALVAILFSVSVSATGVESFDTRRMLLRDSILGNIHGATIPEMTVDIMNFGAKPDGVKDCLPAFKKAMAKIAKARGGRINVPAGTYYLRGPLTLTSNLCINLEAGATLRFDPDPELYPVVNTSWEGTYLYN